jgi:hypothetical protein
MDGTILKLFGHPTPFLAQELKTERTKSKAKSLTVDLNRFFLIIFPFL